MDRAHLLAAFWKGCTEVGFLMLCLWVGIFVALRIKRRGVQMWTDDSR